MKRRLALRDELLLVVLPTVTVLSVLGLVKALGRQDLLCATLASSAMLIYLDPKHETNTVRTLVLAQMTAALVGWALCLLIGPGYLAAGASMTLTIVLMILLDAVHPPAASTRIGVCPSAWGERQSRHFRLGGRDHCNACIAAASGSLVP